VLRDVKASCGCTIPTWPRASLKPGEEGVIEIRFSSAGKEGKQDKTVTVISNAEPKAVVLHIKGEVERGPAARIQFEEVMWYYSRNNSPKKLKKIFTFTNTGDAPLSILSYETNCECLKAELPAQQIAPGAKGEIKTSILTKGCPCEGTVVFFVKTNGFPDEAGITIMPQ
jgi:hypothetical protein